MDRMRIARVILPGVLSLIFLAGCGGGGGGVDTDTGPIGGGGSGTGTGGTPVFWYTYGGNDSSFGYSGRQTADNGFVLTGQTAAAGSPNWNILLVKADSRGALQWQKVLGAPDNALGFATLPTRDNGVVIAGVRGFTATSRGDFYLAKVGPSGNLLWERTHDRNTWNGYRDIQFARTGGAVDGYVLTGGASTGAPNQVALYIQRTDLDGNELWDNVVPVPWHPGFDVGYSVVQARDGGFVVAGAYAEYGPDNAAILAKFASTGAFLWERRFAPGIAYDLVQEAAPEDGFVLVGAVPDGKGKGQTDLLVLKTDAAGAEIRRRTFGLADKEIGWSVARAPDNGYLVAGQTESYSPPDPIHSFLQSDVYLVRLDTNLDPLWIRVKGNITPTGDGATSVEATPDNGFIVGGSAAAHGLLAKFDSLGLNVNIGENDLTLSPSVTPGVIGFSSASATVGAGVAILDTTRSATDAAMAILAAVVAGDPPSDFCVGGGSYVATLTPGPPAPGSVLTVDFDDCAIADGAALNGNVVLTVSSFSGNLTADFAIGADLALDNVTATDAAGTNRIDASYGFLRTSSAGTVSDNVISGPSGFLTSVEQSPARTIGLTDFSAVYLAAAGPLFATGPASGTLSVTDVPGPLMLTIEAATRLEGPDIPSSGTVTVEASDGSSAAATANPSGDATIAVDEDGDGTVDGTLTVPWDSLY